MAAPLEGRRPLPAHGALPARRPGLSSPDSGLGGHRSQCRRGPRLSPAGAGVGSIAPPSR
ncbi:hypothetical protein ACP4OV_010032 [Aristida adscensionis]